MRKILLLLTSLRACKSKLMRKFLYKSNQMIAVSYIMKRKINKIFFEVISNTKIFNIIFFQQNSQRPRFCQTYREDQTKGGLDNVEYGTCLFLMYLRKKVNTEPEEHQQATYFFSPDKICFIKSMEHLGYEGRNMSTMLVIQIILLKINTHSCPQVRL